MATPTNLPASFTSEVLTSAAMNNLRGAFRVLQVVQGTTTTTVGTALTSYISTGLTASITPQSTTSKILVVVNLNGGDKSSANAGNAINARVVRGATQITLFAFSAGYTGTALNIRTGTLGTMYLDSPATIAATTYTVEFANITAAASVSVQIGNEMSTITLMEISA